MRTYKSHTNTVFALILSLLLAACASAQGTTYFDFSGWDSTLIDNGPGQTFTTDIPGVGPVNVTVQGFGDFTIPSSATSTTLQSGHLESGDRNQFHFTFDTSLPLVIQTPTVDQDELVEIIGVGPETYTNLAGTAPTITNVGTAGIRIQGTGFGTNTGAANGVTETAAQVNLPVIIRHDSLFQNKFEFFSIGTTLTAPPVPEPNSVALLGIGALGLLLGGRNKRSRR